MRNKNFKKWICIKESLHIDKREFFFHPREIWYGSIGINIGFEQDGKNNLFERPLLIIKKFNNDLFWAIPLTSTLKRGKYYYSFSFKGKESVAILSQLRLFSSNRLQRKIGYISKNNFQELKEKIKNLI